MTRRRCRRALLGLLLCLPAGCQVPLAQVVAAGWAPEVQALPVRDPATLPPTPIPPTPPPATVADDPAALTDRPLSLNEAVRLALENARVIRVYTGLAASNSGRTIYDAAIAATSIDQQQARFDPTVTAERTRTHTDTPGFAVDAFGRPVITGVQADADRTAFGVQRTNPLGGQASVNLTQNSTFTSTTGSGRTTGQTGFGTGSNLFALGGGLNPQSNPVLTAQYTQPLFQGGGFAVNMAPVVIARLDTERSYFQVKDATQELVRGAIEGYWNLVFARLDVWAREIQVEQAGEALKREEARRLAGIGDIRNVAQARVTLNQFKAALIASRANALAREGSLRNLLGLPPADGTRIVPTSAPAAERFKPDWKSLLEFAGQRRPDVIELKLVLAADRQRQLQAENAALPRLDATALYRWNGLTGRVPSTGERVASDFGQFTDWTVGLTFSVPLGLRQGRAQVREQTLIIQRDRANLEQALHAAGHELAVTVRELENSYEQYLAYRETRAAALTNLQVQVAELGAGRGIYLSVLQALNDWGGAVTSEARALIDYNVRLADLERQTGTILETHGLVFVEERFRAAGPLCLPKYDRCYPRDQKPAGEPVRYPDSGKPGESAFDLTRPAVKPARLGLPDLPEELPPPEPKFGEGRP